MRTSLLFFLACGAALGALVHGLVPDGLVRDCRQKLMKQTFDLARPPEDPAEVTPARWFFLPMLWGDFDLQMDVNLAAGVDLDVLLRQVEPRIVDGELLPFHGRFSVLRLSTAGSDGDAPEGDRDRSGWRTRDEALFGARGGGVDVAPGLLATVWIEARGRKLRANVAGRWQPWFEADDVYGMFTMIARGGVAVVERLKIEPVGEMRWWLWSRWTWIGLGVLGAAVVAAAASMLSRRPVFVTAGAGAVVVAWAVLRGVELDLGFPGVGAMATALATFLGLALVFAWREVAGVAYWLLVGVVLLLAYGASSQLERDDAAVDAVFGRDAGAQLSEAHAQLVRGPTGLTDVEFDGPCVFLLGGQLVYDVGAPGHHLALQLGARLRGRHGGPVEVPCLPTVFGTVAQQWRMFDAFYQGYDPEVVVVGVAADVGEPDGVTGDPAPTPADVVEALREIHRDCEERGRRLVMFAAAGVPDPYLSRLRELAARGVALVVAAGDEEPTALADALADAVGPLKAR